MPTDTERREIAARLRKCTPPTSYGQAQGGGWSHLCDMALAVGLKREDEPTAWELAQRLAYYIDPPYPDATASYKGWRAEVHDPDGVLASPSNVAADLVRAHADGKAPTCDRDALLALAKGLDSKADDIIRAAQHARFSKLGPTMDEAKHDAYELRIIARRILDALGVVDGQEP